MAENPSVILTHQQPTDVSKTGDAMGRAWIDYKQDQLQQLQATVGKAAVLQKHAKERLAERDAALKQAVVAEDDESEPANISRYHALHRMLDEVAFYPAHDKRAESPGY